MTHCCEEEGHKDEAVVVKEEVTAKEKPNYALIAILALLLIVSIFQAAQISSISSGTANVQGQSAATGLVTAEDPMAGHHSGQQSSSGMVGGC